MGGLLTLGIEAADQSQPVINDWKHHAPDRCADALRRDGKIKVSKRRRTEVFSGFLDSDLTSFRGGSRILVGE
jgi:hypothetical protein